MSIKFLQIIISFFIVNILTFCQIPQLTLKPGSRSISKHVAYSENKKYIVSGEENWSVKLWDIEDRIVIKQFKGHSDIVTFADFIDADKRIVSASLDGSVRIWNLDTNLNDIKPEANNIGIKSAAISLDKNYLVGIGIDNNIVIWDLRTGWKSESFGSQKEIVYHKVIFSPDGSKFMISASDNCVYLFDFYSRNILLRKEINEQISDISFSPDSRSFASCGTESSIKLWSLPSGSLIRIIRCLRPVKIISFIPKQDKIIGSMEDNILQIWDATTGSSFKFLSGHKSAIFSLDVSDDGSKVVSSSSDLTIRTWDILRGKETTILTSNKNIIAAVKCFNNGKNIAAASYTGKLYLWDLEMGICSGSYKIHEGEIKSISVSRNNDFILTTGIDGLINIFDIKNLRIAKTFKGHTDIVSGAEYINNDTSIISISYDKSIKFWDIESERCTKTITSPQNQKLKCLAVSEDGTKFAVGGADKNIFIWNILTKTLINNLEGHSDEVNTLCFSNDGKKIYSGGKDRLLVEWNVEKKTELQAYDIGQDNISSISISKNNRYLAFGSSDKIVYLWNIRKGTPNTATTFLEGHENNVSCVSFSNDNRYLVTGSWDGLIKLWNFESKTIVATLMPLENDNFVISLPNNYYTCTREGLNSVFFRISDSEYPYNQFDLIFNRPDIVLKEIGYGSNELIDNFSKMYEGRLRDLKIDPASLSAKSQLPDLLIENKNEINPINESGSVMLKIKAEDFNSRLYRLILNVNGVPFYGKKGLDLVPLFTFTFNSYVFYSDITIPLNNGLNKIQVSVMNELGTESLRQFLEINYSNPLKEFKPNLFAISIGISNYKDTILNLRYASKDASDFADFIKINENRYRSVSLFKLCDHEATKERILKLKELLKLSDVNDEVMIFISGQGLFDKDLNYYFATYETDARKPGIKGLSLQELESLFDNISSRKRVLFLNTCNSGEVDEEDLERMQKLRNIDCRPLPEEPYSGYGKSSICPVIGAYELQKFGTKGYKKTLEFSKNQFVNLINNSGAVVIASSSNADEYPMNNNGAFTFSILEGLKNLYADSNDDRSITISELKDYVINNVKFLTNDRIKPIVRKEVLDNDFKIW